MTLLIFKKKIAVILLLFVFFSLCLKAQEDVGIGSPGELTERVLKEYANTETWLNYQKTTEWEEYYKELVDIHQVWINNDFPMILAFTFKGRVVHIISALTPLSGSNIGQSDLNNYKDFLRSNAGIKEGFNYLGDGIYYKKCLNDCMDSYVSFVSLTTSDGIITFMFESKYKEGVVAMKSSWANKLTNAKILKLQYL